MSTDLIQVRTDGPVGHVLLNRPQKLNALNQEMLAEMVGALTAFERDPTVRAVVLSGGPRAFAAGADIGTLGAATPLELYRSGFSDFWDTAAAFSKPLVAAVEGYALGGGLELALGCDIIVASETAVFGLPETGIGTIPGAGGTQRLVRTVGKSLAMEMLLSGRRISAAEALAAGLASTLVPPGQASEAASALAARIARASPVASVFAKEAVLAALEMPLSAGIRHERVLSSLIAASEDHHEGMRAFAEKRTPDFPGR